MRGIAGPEKTIITAPATAPVVRFANFETRAAVLEGFTITGGHIVLPNEIFGAGGGIRVGSSPTIRNNYIQDNVSCDGGAGILVSGGGPRIESNTIRRNSAYCGPNIVGFIGGGGLYLIATTAEIIGNTISDNTASVAAAVLMNNAGSPVLMSNTITRNTAVSSQCDFGAIALINSSSPHIIQNVISVNQPCALGISVPSEVQGPYILSNTFALNDFAEALFGGFFQQVRVVNNVFFATSGRDAVICDGVR